MPEIRMPERNDTPFMKKQWKNCFCDSDEYIDSFFRHIYNRENTLALYEDGQMASYLMMFPKKLCVNGSEVKGCYIGGVCTQENLRRRGYAARLLEAAFERIKDEKNNLSYLVPVRCDFYRRLGYEAVSYVTVLEGKTDRLERYKECFVQCDNRIEVYKTMCRGKGIYEVRTAQDFDEITEFVRLDGGDFFCTENAYMYYNISNGLFDVCELAFANYKGLCEMLSHIGSCRDAENFRIRGSFELCDYVCERDISIRLVPYAMVRHCNNDLKITRNTENYINMPIWE